MERGIAFFLGALMMALLFGCAAPSGGRTGPAPSTEGGRGARGGGY